LFIVLLKGANTNREHVKFVLVVLFAIIKFFDYEGFIHLFAIGMSLHDVVENIQMEEGLREMFKINCPIVPEIAGGHYGVEEGVIQH